jgi:hypothetical protein
MCFGILFCGMVIGVKLDALDKNPKDKTPLNDAAIACVAAFALAWRLEKK